MIVIACPLMKDKVKDIVLNIEGLDAKHIKTEGINMYFETNRDDDEAIDIIKPAIKADPISGSLIIKVRREDAY